MLKNRFGRAAPVLGAQLWLSAACASYEQTPSLGSDAPSQECESDPRPCAGGSTSGAGMSGRGGSSITPPRGGSTSSGSGGSAGTSAGAASGGSAQGGTNAVGGAAGEPSSGGAASGGTGPDTTQLWAFEQGADGWTVRDQSPELATALVPAGGAVRLTDIPFTAPKQFVDVAFTFASPADLRGRTLRATVQRTAGEFVGAQLYVYGGAWGSPGFESLSSGNVTVLSVSVDALAAMGVTPASVSRIGLKLGTGSNAANTFGPTTVELAEVSLE